MRYTIASDPATVLHLLELIALVKARTAADQGDDYGRLAKQFVPFEDKATAVAAVEAIAALTDEQRGDLSYLVLMDRQDLLNRPSFLWDLRNGEIPDTGTPGEHGVVGHYAIPLAPGRDYFSQFIPQGDCSPLVAEGWAAFYYSESACHATAKQIQRLLGSGWTMTAKRLLREQGVPICYSLRFTSTVANLVELSFTLVGQGQILIGSITTLEHMAKGAKFFNVLDTDSGRLRSGSDCRGGVWQYP